MNILFLLSQLVHMEMQDALSCSPLPVQPAQSLVPMETVLLMEHLASRPVTAQNIRA